MFRKLLALLLLIAVLPGCAAAVPVRSGQTVVLPLPDGELRFWDTSGADAWAERDAELFGGAPEVLTVVAAQLQSNDCFILACGGTAALIDCGTLGETNLVPQLLDQLGIKRFDYIVNTHPHDDHINGIFELLPMYDTGKIYVGFDRHYRNLNKRLFRDAEALGVPIEQMQPPTSLPLGAAELNFYQVPGATTPTTARWLRA